MFLIMRAYAEGWVTINGNHVYIGGSGIITKGPANLLGKKINEDGSITRVSDNRKPKRTQEDLVSKYGSEYLELSAEDRVKLRKRVDKGMSKEQAYAEVKGSAKTSTIRRTHEEMVETYGEAYGNMSPEQRARFRGYIRGGSTVQEAYDKTKVSTQKKFDSIKSEEFNEKYGDTFRKACSDSGVNVATMTQKFKRESKTTMSSEGESLDFIKSKKKNNSYGDYTKNLSPTERNTFYGAIRKGQTPEDAFKTAKSPKKPNYTDITKDMSPSQKNKFYKAVESGMSSQEALNRVTNNVDNRYSSPYSDFMKGMTQTQRAAFNYRVKKGVSPEKAKEEVFNLKSRNRK